MGKMVGMFSIFKNKKVLITGDTGFKGSWLSLWLTELGAEVLGYALPPNKKENHYNVIGLNKIVRHIDGNILDFNKFKRVCETFKPEFIFHLAAQPLVRLSYKEPKLTFDTNIGGSTNILEVSRNLKSLRVLVYITSDKCYLNKGIIWGYRESDELGGHDPYSASKAAAEIIFSSYLKSFFSENKNIGAASVRAGNVIGGGDWSDDRLIPDCMRSLVNNKTIIIRNPGSTRPWQHVLEPLSGYLQLAVNLYKEPKKYSGSWNFGPNDKTIWNVEKVVNKIIEFWGSGKLKVENKRAGMEEAKFLHLNCDKASYNLNWNPRWDIKKTLYETVYWYKKFNLKNKMLEVSKSQIKKYMEDKND